MILGYLTVKDLKGMFSKNTKILWFPKDMAPDLAEKFLYTVASHPTVKNIVLHIGSNDVAKQHSVVLK